MVVLRNKKYNIFGLTLSPVLIICFMLLLIIIPQLLNFGKCVPMYDMIEYLRLGENPFTPVDPSFTYRILVPLLVYYFNYLTSIPAPTIFWFIGLLSSILYYLVIYLTLKAAFSRSHDSINATYYAYSGVLTYIFCFTFQFYFRDYIFVDQLALLLGLLMVLFYFYDNIILLSIVSVLAVLTKENNLILAIFISIMFGFNKNKKTLYLLFPLIAWLMLRLFWFKSQSSLVDSHFLMSNITTILKYHIRMFPTTLTPIYGVFGFLYLVYFYDLFTKSDKETRLIFLYFVLISISSLLVSGSFRAFAYFTPFIIYKTIPIIMNSRFRSLIFMNIILTNLIMVFPYLWMDWYEPTILLRTCLSILAVFINLVSFVYIIKQKGLIYKLENFSSQGQIS